MTVAEGEELAAEGAARAYAGATEHDRELLEGAALAAAILSGPEGFTTDDVWHHVGGLRVDGDRRALGQVMRRFQKIGLIEATETYRKSERPECHANPKRVWRRT